MSLNKTHIGLAIFLILLFSYLLFWPVPGEPVAWTPREAPPLTGPFQPNSYLSKTERLGRDTCPGPEDIAVDKKGRIYCGTSDGRIIRLRPDGSNPELFAETGGRPLGLCFDDYSNLIVADAYIGLLSISRDGTITILCTSAVGKKFMLTDDVDIAKDGTIYFTDATYKYPLHDYKLDGMEHRPHGRLLAYYPESGETRVLLDKLYFANGVAVSPDQTFLLVNETWKYRIKRYWLKGPKKGTSEIFLDNLPGVPDGISCNGKDIFWVALPSPRDKKIDDMMSKPFLRKIIMRLPSAIIPMPKPYSFVLGFDLKGNVIHNLQDPEGSFNMITSVEQHKDVIYLGSVYENGFGRIKIQK